MSSINSFARTIVDRIVSNGSIWNPVSKTLVRSCQFLCAMRNEHEVETAVANHPPLRIALE